MAEIDRAYMQLKMRLQQDRHPEGTLLAEFDAFKSKVDASLAAVEARAVKAEGERDAAARKLADLLPVTVKRWGDLPMTVTQIDNYIAGLRIELAERVAVRVALEQVIAERDAAKAKYQKQLILHREAQQACARNKRSWKASRMREVLQGIINDWKAEAMSVRRKLEEVEQQLQAAEARAKTTCFHCGEQIHEHKPNCAYVLAMRRLTELELDGGTYGELPESVQQLIEGHKWDNMTRGEQRSWLIELAVKHVELKNNAEQLGLWFRQNEQALEAANARIAGLESFEGCDGCSTGDCPHSNVNDCVQAQGRQIAALSAQLANAEKPK